MLATQEGKRPGKGSYGPARSSLTDTGPGTSLPGGVTKDLIPAAPL